MDSDIKWFAIGILGFLLLVVGSITADGIHGRTVYSRTLVELVKAGAEPLEAAAAIRGR